MFSGIMESKQPRKGTVIMKKTLLVSLLLLFVAIALLLAGCGVPADEVSGEGTALGNGAGTGTDTTAGTADETSADEAFLDAEGKPLPPEEQALAEVAAEALWAGRDLPAKGHFKVSIHPHASDGSNRVRFTLHIGGYRTDEYYNVRISADGEVIEIDGGYHSYRQFIKGATSERIAAAEASLAEQMGHLADKENSGYYLSIDSEGYLCLSCEVIVQLSGGADGDGGCGIDHEHKFFNARICAPN